MKQVDPTKKSSFRYPSPTTKGITLRDFSKGRIAKSSVNSNLIESNFPNSVANSMNVNYDTIIGSGVVRLGTTKVGATVASGKTPLGLFNFVGTSGTPNLIVAAFTGASNSTIYYYDSTWNTSGLTALNNTNKIRFAQIGGRVFMVNGTDQMKSSADGSVWDSTNCITWIGVSVNPPTPAVINIPFVKPSLILRSKQRLLLGGDPAYKDRIFFSSVISPYAVANAVTVTLTASTTVATGTTSAAHGFAIGDYVTIKGANQTAYNGTFIVTGTPLTTTFNYVMNSSPVSPATGTITVYPAEITYDSDKLLGDWIDINPDDGMNVSALAETSNQVMVFKYGNGGGATYRLDVINKTVDSQNIFNIGAVSQEGVVSCQGIVYFYSGIDIRATDGTYPQQISRLGVQDFLDAVPAANQSSVCAGTDGLNVYFSIGNVTLNTNKDAQVTYNNVVLKFSPRDQSWSVHSYAQAPLFYYTYSDTTDGFKMISADVTGVVQKVNKGNTDNTAPIYFFLETQDIEFGNRANTKSYNDNVAIFASNGIESTVQVKSDENGYSDLTDTLPLRVNVIEDMKFNGHYATFRWMGSTTTTQPRFEGIYLPNINDEGLQSTTT